MFATMFTPMAPSTIKAETNTVIKELSTTMANALTGLDIPVAEASIAPIVITKP